MRNGFRGVFIVVVALGFAVSAWAQSTGTGAFAKLSPGDQKIARALFEAQSTTQNKNGTTTPFTLDQIAGMKKAGHASWGEVFKHLKAQGLVTAKNLGQVASSYERHHPELAAKPDNPKPDKLEKPDKIDKPAHPEKPGR